MCRFTLHLLTVARLCACKIKMAVLNSSTCGYDFLVQMHKKLKSSFSTYPTLLRLVFVISH